MTKTPLLEVKNLSCAFSPSEKPSKAAKAATKAGEMDTGFAVKEVSLELERGQTLALLGASGCGKTTTLRMIAGFESPSSGQVILNGRDITNLSPQKRDIGIVFQNYSLFPNMNVQQNVQFGLDGLKHRQKQKAHAEEKEQSHSPELSRAEHWLELLGLEKLSKRRVHELSGGQQQRVAIARALAGRPQLMLLDEPFSGLDAALRESTRSEIRQLFHQLGTTAILVTHDQIEAMSFADKMGIMHAGQLLQIGSPEEIYLHPKSSLIAEFLGAANTFKAKANGKSASSIIGQLDLYNPHHGDCLVSLRPEQLEIIPDNEGIGIITERNFRGREFAYVVSLYHQENSHSTSIRVISPICHLYEIGSRVSLKANAPAALLESLL